MAKNHKKDNPDEEMYVEIDLDEGLVKCAIITIFDANYKNEINEYIALMPLDEDGEGTGDVWIYGHKEDKNDPNAEPELRYIDSEDEYEVASDAFDEYLDNQDFDEWYGDDESDDSDDSDN